MRTVTSSKSHFCILLNAGRGQFLVFAVVSSKLDETIKKVARAKQPPETMVRITPKDYPSLSVESVVNCNDPKTITEEEVRANYRFRRVKVCPPMKKEIVERIVAGVLMSDYPTRREKAAVVGAVK